MTTATNVFQMNDLGTARVGKDSIRVTAFSIDLEGHHFDVYKAADGTFYEPCGRCSSASGFKPEFAHVYGGICFQCGGVGVYRMGSEMRLKKLIRGRVNGRKNRLNAVERKEAADAAAALKWAESHPNVAGLLAQVRGGPDRNTDSDLMSIALSAQRKPLSVAQERYAERLLLQRALNEAVPDPERVHYGNVGEAATLSGTVRTAITLPPFTFGGKPPMLIVLETKVGANVAAVTMKTTAAWAYGVERGDLLSVSGVVDLHDEHPVYGLQTRLKRPKMV